jgi:hypothetical protein
VRYDPSQRCWFDPTERGDQSVSRFWSRTRQCVYSSQTGMVASFDRPDGSREHHSGIEALKCPHAHQCAGFAGNPESVKMRGDSIVQTQQVEQFYMRCMQVYRAHTMQMGDHLGVLRNNYWYDPSLDGCHQ